MFTQKHRKMCIEQVLKAFSLLGSKLEHQTHVHSGSKRKSVEMRTIFHIATQKEWNQAQSKGFYETGSLKEEGFIHFSRPHQVIGVTERHFKGCKDLVLLEIPQEKIQGDLKYEGSETNKFPHLYGPLNLDAVTDTFPFHLSENVFQWPAKYRMVYDVLIRPGIKSDAAEIASAHLNAWRESYQGIVPDSYLNKLPLSFRGRMKFWEFLFEKASDTTTFVAESADHGVVGFSTVGEPRDDAYKGWGELAAIYLLNPYKKKGVGQALFEISFEKLKSLGFKKAYCWVLKDNPAVEFYKRSGAQQGDGQKLIQLEKELTEIPMEWLSL
jgi:uncharacterized protein (DUF952 family)/GNAT superfamily N-acetyltransferase